MVTEAMSNSFQNARQDNMKRREKEEKDKRAKERAEKDKERKKKMEAEKAKRNPLVDMNAGNISYTSSSCQSGPNTLYKNTNLQPPSPLPSQSL